MSKQEDIELLTSLACDIDTHVEGEKMDALERAIEALKAEPLMEESKYV